MQAVLKSTFIATLHFYVSLISESHFGLGKCRKARANFPTSVTIHFLFLIAISHCTNVFMGAQKNSPATESAKDRD